MGARTEEEELKKEKAIVDQQPSVVEVEVNLTLINNKLNYIISKIDDLTKDPRIK
jgi:hypothetical protein|tara:strand:+ start:4600 stop:4764 length:165 start_codon:yes stop_codon:yes gene_type:complete